MNEKINIDFVDNSLKRKEIMFLNFLIKNHKINIKTSREELKAKSVLCGLSISSFNNYFFVWKALNYIKIKTGYILINEVYYKEVLKDAKNV